MNSTTAAVMNGAVVDGLTMLAHGDLDDTAEDKARIAILKGVRELVAEHGLLAVIEALRDGSDCGRDIEEDNKVVGRALTAVVEGLGHAIVKLK